jgi:hypothetical protein
VNAAQFKPLPIPPFDRAMMIWQTLLKSGFDQMPVTPADYLDGKQQSSSFESMSTAFAIPEYGSNISGTGEPERVLAAMYSPVVGQNFLPEEKRPGGPPTVIISQVHGQRR